jgi:glycosyltransferase involved in cell wall biosynthesis
MNEDNSFVINILANSIAGPMSGGDRIWIECAKRWTKERGIIVKVFTTEEGIERGQYYGLRRANYVLWSSSKFKKFGVYIIYIWRIIKGCIAAIRISKICGKNVVIFSSSDFMPDSIPAWIMKMRLKNSKWVAAFYLFAPSPFNKESPYKRKLLIRGLLYYLSQIPIYWLIKKYADMVWVTNEVDRWKFIDNKKLTPDKVIAVRGGVDIKTPAFIPEPKEKEFDAVFIGRFHPQKGVLELIDIWRYVCDKKKDAKLAMIGVGELENEIRIKVKKYRLENNIVFFGFKDGIEKLKIFKDSKIVVHPAIYDSGGMAICEAMTCGLPGVSFDLPALKSYYPKGMLKAPCFDLKKFAVNILSLLENQELYKKLSKEALEWAQGWDWDKRSKELLEVIQKLSKEPEITYDQN